MSFKKVDTAGDLVRFRASLRIECTACAATRTMTAAQVIQRCGTGNLERIRKRFRCARCGKKSACLVVLPPV
jgi:ribosomal protein L44E